MSAKLFLIVPSVLKKILDIKIFMFFNVIIEYFIIQLIYWEFLFIINHI